MSQIKEQSLNKMRHMSTMP